MRDGRHESDRGHQGPEFHASRDRRVHGRGGQRSVMEGAEPRIQSAQTFRRGRAIAFLDRLEVKRRALAQQLNQPEYDAIKPVISGELKAVDEIIQEFIHLFELREVVTDEHERD
ncbi:hypothetical protein MJ257_07345 [Paenibacillus timonensis]|uniref:Uncharacterized protein n=1 Tax=Paenibacillus timonensis TaxID=225915 RepID=A0ABW3SBH2_9BACL|nr:MULTISPECIES: hypothetical protein [Paenibacillus]MCH1639913.1 hypothetical protein [Paenibacillus timonensis]MDU2241046.1 hypothetical protein [Paenibacillus sp.]